MEQLQKKSTRSRKTWPEADTDFLVSLYSSYGVPLWNTFLPQNNIQKVMAMNNIVAVMKARGYEESDVKQKINYLCTKYKHELCKTVENPQYKPHASWYGKMDSFMRPHTKIKHVQKRKAGPKKREHEDANTTPVKKNVTSCETPSSDGANSFDVFGKCIAAQLKVLPKDVAIDTQFRIQAILTDQTLMLGEPNGSKQDNK